jgi:hypothetical protein
MPQLAERRRIVRLRLDSLLLIDEWYAREDSNLSPLAPEGGQTILPDGARGIRPWSIYQSHFGPGTNCRCGLNSSEAWRTHRGPTTELHEGGGSSYRPASTQRSF